MSQLLVNEINAYTGSTVVINGVTIDNGVISATTYVNIGSEFTGGTVTGPTTFSSGLSATTISATTYQNLPTDIRVTGGTYSAGTAVFTNNTGGTFNVTGFTTNGSSQFLNITYSGLVSAITGSTLTAGTYYIITDFRSCYDQPDFNIFGNAITTGNYKQAAIEPIMVFATSANTISTTAYQPAYPNDRIQYDWTFNTTEITSGVAYGRISERIDEFNNRTDYDHRTILFKRYKLFTFRPNQPLNGTIELFNDGTISGTSTSFTTLTVGDVVYIPSTSPSYYEIISITGNTAMTVSGDTITAVGAGQQIFPTILETNDSNGYFSYKRTNVKTNDFIEYTTFGDAISNDYAKNTYVGNFAYQNAGSGFILANNVFLEGAYESNKFGDYCYNNTFGTDNQNNIWGDYCYGNVSTNDIDDNIIGHYFNNNLINVNLTSNHIGNDFSNNKLLAENSENFEDNIIENDFTNNTIYSWFYSNEILNNFSNNIIGDFDDLTNFQFYGNIIGTNFTDNIITDNFYKNEIGYRFYDNQISGETYTNRIGEQFETNTIYSNFYRNEILSNFNDNLIGDSGNLGNFEFYENRIGNDFYENTIRQDFQNNQIGNQYNNNVVNGDFYKNVIGNGFNNNPNIGHNFYGNNIGNGFNDNNLIGDYFKENKIGENFNSNSISYLFENNQIGNTFENNTLGDTDYFNWDNTSIENLTGRTYNTFYNSLYGEEGQAVGNVILGKELIMRFLRNSGTTITSGDLVIDETYEITNYQGSDDFSNVADVISGDINTNGCIFIATGTTPTEWSSNSELTELTSYNEYHKVKFTQWTQNNNGGGFSYERTKVYPTVDSTVYFTKTNNSSVSDIIIPSRLEIRRNNNGAIYNDVLENSWNQNVSPEGTEWNSIYTQNNNGSDFAENIIFNDFKGNYIRGVFGGNKIDSVVGSNEFSGNTYLNNIGFLTYDNDFLGDVFGNNWEGNFYNNTIGDSFGGNSFGDSTYNNTIGEDFFSNNIKENFYQNTIGDGFQTNQIGAYFNNNTIADYFGYGYGAPQGNKIGSNFYNNTVGEYFYNNIIPDNFTENTIGEYFQWNVVNTIIDNTDFTLNYGNISGFTYTATGTSATDNIYTGLTGTTNGVGVNASFDVEVSGNAVIGVSGNTSGKLYHTGDTITILGTTIGGYSNSIDSISDDGVGKNGSDGTYNDLSVTGGTGTNATFDVSVNSGLVDGVVINNRGIGYEINDELTIIGSLFGGTDGIDDITITVTALFDDDITITVSGVTKPSVYEHYTCQIFERQGGNKRLSFYDENDILTIKNINE